MLKEKKVYKEEIEQQKFCDVCGEEIKKIGLGCTAAKCAYCGNDLCKNCIGHEDESWGDYRTVYCKKCWEIGDVYRPKIDKLELELESLYKEWQDKCNR